MGHREYVVCAVLLLVGCDKPQEECHVPPVACPDGHACMFDKHCRALVLDPKTGLPLRYVEDWGK